MLMLKILGVTVYEIWSPLFFFFFFALLCFACKPRCEWWIGQNIYFLLFVSYYVVFRMERQEKSLENCGVSGLFLTWCLSKDMFKTEYAVHWMRLNFEILLQHVPGKKKGKKKKKGKNRKKWKLCHASLSCGRKSNMEPSEWVSWLISTFEQSNSGMQSDAIHLELTCCTDAVYVEFVFTRYDMLILRFIFFFCFFGPQPGRCHPK